MIRVTTPGGEPDAALLRAMFEARKAVFVDLLRWDVPVLGGRYEMDQFDDEHARYLILSDADGHVASARLLPTTRAGILSGLYPMLCAGPLPSAADIFEITRFCLDVRLDSRARREARDALIRALAAYAQDTQIARYCAVAGLSWFRQIERFGWDCHALGQPARLDGQDLVALEITITPETLAQLDAGGIRASGIPSPTKSTTGHDLCSTGGRP